jgi:hypothetical protein
MFSPILPQHACPQGRSAVQLCEAYSWHSACGQTTHDPNFLASTRTSESQNLKPNSQRDLPLMPTKKNAFTPAAQAILSALPLLTRVSLMVRLYPAPPAKNQAASFLDTSKAELGVVLSMGRLHGISTTHGLRPSFMQT